MHKELPDDKNNSLNKIRICPFCGRVLLDGEVEIEVVSLDPILLSESCPFCKHEI